MEFKSSECKPSLGNYLQVFTVQTIEGKVMLAGAFCPSLVFGPALQPERSSYRDVLEHSLWQCKKYKGCSEEKVGGKA